MTTKIIDTLPDILRLIAKNRLCTWGSRRKTYAGELTELFEDSSIRARLATITLQSLVDEEYTARGNNFYENAEKVQEKRAKKHQLASLPVSMFKTDREIIAEYLDRIVDDGDVRTNLAQGIRFADYLLYMNTHFVSYDIENYMRRVMLIELMSVIEGMFISVGAKYKMIHSILIRDIFPEEVQHYLDEIDMSFENKDGEPYLIGTLSLGDYKRRPADTPMAGKDLLDELKSSGAYKKKKRILRDWAFDDRKRRINEFLDELEELVGAETFSDIESKLNEMRQMRNKIHYFAIDETIRTSGEFSFEAVSEAHALMENVSRILTQYVESREDAQSDD